MSRLKINSRKLITFLLIIIPNISHSEDSGLKELRESQTGGTLFGYAIGFNPKFETYQKIEKKNGKSYITETFRELDKKKAYLCLSKKNLKKTKVIISHISKYVSSMEPAFISPSADKVSKRGDCLVLIEEEYVSELPISLPLSFSFDKTIDVFDLIKKNQESLKSTDSSAKAIFVKKINNDEFSVNKKCNGRGEGQYCSISLALNKNRVFKIDIPNTDEWEKENPVNFYYDYGAYGFSIEGIGDFNNDGIIDLYFNYTPLNDPSFSQKAPEGDELIFIISTKKGDEPYRTYRFLVPFVTSC